MTIDDDIESAGKEQPFKEVTELGSVMENLDSDTIDKDTKMTNVDFNTRLNTMEINSILIIDELVRLGIFPEEAGITRQKKRLNISTDGWGRNTKVDIIRGERESRAGGGFMDKFSNLFRRQE